MKQVSQSIRLRVKSPAAVLGYAGVAMAYLLACASALVLRVPLGHDEGVYALRGRDLAEGWSHLSGGYWSDYRAPGLPMLLRATTAVLPERVPLLRLVVVVLGLVVLTVTWKLTRSAAGWLAATIAAACLVATSWFVASSSLLLADVPGAAFALMAIAIFWRELSRGGLRWSLVAVPVLGLCATLCRFGAPFMLGSGLAAATLVVAPQILRDREWVTVARIAVIGVATAVPSAIVLLTGAFTLGGDSPVGANSALAGSKDLTAWTGFRDLREVVNPWSGSPTPVWSKPVVVIMVLGIVMAWVSAALGRTPRVHVAFATIAGVLSLVSVTASVGQVVPNYLMLSLPFWCMLVGIGWVSLLNLLGSGQWSAAPRFAAGLAGVVSAVLLLLASMGDAREWHRANQRAYGPVVLAAEHAREELGDGCILLSSYIPQVAYYSGCVVTTYGSAPTDEDLGDVLVDAIADAQGLDDEVRSDAAAAVYVEKGKRQPTLEQWEAGEDYFGPQIFEIGEVGQGRAHVWVDRLRPCVFEESGCQ